MQNYKTFAKHLKLTKLSEIKYSKKPVNSKSNISYEQFTKRRKAIMLYTLPSVILQLNFRTLHSFMSPRRLTF